MHRDELAARRSRGQDLLAIGRVVDLARVAGAADDAPAAEDAEEPGEDAAVLVRRPVAGRWTTEKYMGPFSWGIGLFTCCCLCFMCCPCDERQVYHEVSGRKLLQSGGPSGRFNEMCRTTASRLAQ